MEPIYTQTISIEDGSVDRFGNEKLSHILYIAQEMGGRHSELLNVDYDSLSSRKMFWAVTRHGVQISRLPHLGETLRVETWPLPPTRAAFPRSVIAYDEAGEEVFRVMTLWVLMDLESRRMILPGKSGISVPGTVRGNELALPGGLIPRPLGSQEQRPVRFSDLDRNGHMNNTRCMDWIDDLFPSSFHGTHIPSEFAVCYKNEAREGEVLTMNHEILSDTCIQVDARTGEDSHIVFSARIGY